MTNDDLFLDTSGLLCLFDKADSRHQKAQDFFHEAKSLVTSNYVLAEFLPLVMSRKLHRTSSLLAALGIVAAPDAGMG